jgi:phospholipid/cholesterol/gamma-HCH transport system substrate-binding protein
MYASRTTQFIVGLFALLGVMALAILSFRLGRVTILPTPGYLLYANFDNISGLKPGDEIDIAGVKVGSVSGATLQGNQAHVTLHLNKGVEVDDDAIASIKSSGIIGGKYVSIAWAAEKRRCKMATQSVRPNRRLFWKTQSVSS